MEPFTNDRLQLPRNMIENSMFEEEPDVVDLAKEPCLHPLEPDEVEYEPRGSRLLVRGLGEHELDEDEEDYESSAKLLGMSFMNRSSGLRNSAAGYRPNDGTCSAHSARTIGVCIFIIIVAVAVIMMIYLLPRCTFTKEGCHKKNQPMEPIQPIATNGKLFPWAQIRLPTAVAPVRYDLTLHPNLTSMTFRGSVTISLQALQATWNIVLHSTGHNISRVTFMTAVSSQEKEVDVLEYPLHEQIAIVAPETLLEGHNYTLKIEYSANISSSSYGFYGISYRDESNEKKYFAATQFEPLAARSAFPCFDEPAFKATFVIRIKRDEQYTALSNMPKKSSVVLEDGLVQDEFFESVKMSTYLVAFIVGEMKNLSQDVNGTLVSIYAVPEKIGQVHHALETTAKLLDFYQNYFEIQYPLKKLDLVAIPDFEAGAMENWGLLTFREETLLYDGNTSSVADRKLVTKIIAHELAHQWFGNLVTMQWWNDLWLNEGFATFMEYFSLEKIFGELSSYEDFLDARFKTMRKDALNSSHPISSSSVQSSEQIEEMFDSLSYFKGASLLLMLKTYLSEDIFQHAIILYLHNHSYTSTHSDDLWDSFNESTNKTLDVKKMMRTWTLQKGFPLVTVQRKGKQILVQQERFSLNVKPEIQPSDASSLWHIPLSYVTDGKNYSKHRSVSLLDKKSGVINLTEEVQWIKVNTNMTGYYIVHYADDNWEALIKQLKTNPYVLSDKDRANLINNIFELAGLGKVSLQRAFDLIDYLRNETYTAPISEALFQTELIYNLLDKLGHMDLASRLVNKVFKLLQSQIQQQTWTDEGTPSIRELRSVLLDFACTHSLENCSAAALKLFNDWMASNGTQSLPTDVMATVFKAGAKTEGGWSFLLSKYVSLGSEAEKNKILEALASSEDVRKLYWLMKKSLDGDVIRTQKLSFIIRTVARHFPGHLLAWDFVKENWSKLVQKFHLGSYTIQSIVAGSTHLFSTKAHLSEVQAFFENQSEATFQLRCVQEALEVIQLNMQWVEKNLKTLTYWL